MVSGRRESDTHQNHQDRGACRGKEGERSGYSERREGGDGGVLEGFTQEQISAAMLTQSQFRVHLELMLPSSLFHSRRSATAEAVKQHPLHAETTRPNQKQRKKDTQDQTRDKVKPGLRHSPPFRNKPVPSRECSHVARRGCHGLSDFSNSSSSDDSGSISRLITSSSTGTPA